MATPTVSASLNKASYSPGDTMTLTVTYGDADNQTIALSITATDAAGNKGTANVNVVIADPTTLAVSDPSGRTWTKQSDSGSVAVFTSKA